MIKNPGRRDLMKRAGVVGALGLAATAGETVAAGSASASGRSPVGTWSVVIVKQDEPNAPELGLFAFTGDGTFIQSNTGTRYAGLGTWRPTAKGFRFAFREQSFDDTGALAFEVHITAEAVMTSADAFTANGVGKAYAPDGTLLATTQTTGQGTRYGLDG
jgi:hypothetical protein